MCTASQSHSPGACHLHQQKHAVKIRAAAETRSSPWTQLQLRFFPESTCMLNSQESTAASFLSQRLAGRSQPRGVYIFCWCINTEQKRNRIKHQNIGQRLLQCPGWTFHCCTVCWASWHVKVAHVCRTRQNLSSL